MEDRHTLAKRALGYVELYGAYTETDARYRVDNLLELWDAGDAEDHERVLLRPGGHRLGPLRPRDPPPVGGRARPGPHHARASRWSTSARTGPATGHPVARPAPGRLRPRAHAHGLQRGGHLRLAGQPPPVRRPDGRASWPTSCGRRRRCSPWTAGTGATSCARSTGASRTRPSSSCAPTRGSCSTASS